MQSIPDSHKVGGKGSLNENSIDSWSKKWKLTDSQNLKWEESPYTEHNLLAGSLESETYFQNIPRDSKDPPSSPEMMLIWETT